MFFKAACLLVVLLVVTASAQSNSCTDAQVTGKVYSAVDSTTGPHTTVVADLTLKCKNGIPAHYPLYGEFNGRTYIAAQNKEDPSKYQISISDQSKRFPSSYVEIRVLDENGYQLTRKGDNSHKALTSLEHSVRSPYSGPSFNSELLVAMIGAVAVYLAHGIRSRMYL